MVTKDYQNKFGVYGKACWVYIHTYVVNLKHKMRRMQKVYAVTRLGAFTFVRWEFLPLSFANRSSVHPILASANIMKMSLQLITCSFSAWRHEASA